MKLIGLCLSLAAVLFLLPASAGAYTIIEGLYDCGNVQFANYLRGGDAHGDWTGSGYGYTMPSTIGYTAGNTTHDTANGAARNGSWVQQVDNGNGVFDATDDIAIWDFGLNQAQSRVDVFPFIDHVNPPETALLEGVEFRVYGSNDLASWNAATWTTAWTQGFDAGTIYDDYTSRWSFGANSYRFIGIVAGNTETAYWSTDAEIDAIGACAPVPEPASCLLLGGALLGVGGFSLRRRRRQA